MDDCREMLPLFSPLLRYPHDGQLAAAETAVAKFAGQPGVAELLRAYAAFLERHTRRELEEKYTRTFEINPAVALEVGYHLFGLAYQRGAFLVRAKQAAEELGVNTGSELADHLPVMLEIAAALDEPTGLSLVQEAIFPAVRHMSGGFAGEGGYGEVVVALNEFLGAHYECVVYAPSDEAQEEEVNSHV